MNIYEMSEKYKITLVKLRRLHKDGHLRCEGDPGEELVSQMRHYLGRGQPLTVEMLIELIENPGTLIDLGHYAGKARAQVEALGDVKGETAPRAVSAGLSDATAGDGDAVEAVADWIRGVLPEGGAVSHHWLATRLLMSVPAGARKYDLKRAPIVLLKARGLPKLKGWFYTEKSKGRTQTFYARPKGFDL